MTPTWSLRRLHALDDAHIDALAGVLIDCVEGGASVSFMQPLTRDRASAFWRRVAHGVAAGERALLVAEDAQGLCGTVQLVFDLPENQPHRADLSKMLVHRRVRRQGLGARGGDPGLRFVCPWRALRHDGVLPRSRRLKDFS